MKQPDFTTTFMVEQSPGQVFAAINNVRGWWSEEIEGTTNKPDAVFNYHFEDVHRSTMKIVEFVPDRKVVWLVLDNYFKFTKDKTEWKGNKIIFEIKKAGDKTQLRFTQEGLVPDYECYEICEKAWTQYVQQSLFNLVTTGKGQPNAKGKPKTADEKKMGAKEKELPKN